MARPAKWKSPTEAVRVPSKYAEFISEVCRALEDFESFVQNPHPPFEVGDRVLIPYAYPDFYEVFQVTRIGQITDLGRAEFWFFNPKENRESYWVWHPFSGIIPFSEGDSHEKAMRRSLILKSLEGIFLTGFRTKLASLEGVFDHANG